MVEFMQLALEEAKKGLASEEVPVGTCVVVDQTVVALTHNLCIAHGNPLAHAEVLAISSVINRYSTKFLSKATLYVTLEPCIMCAAAISYARIKKVVYGALNPKFGAIDSGPRIFSGKQSLYCPEIIGGIMARQAEEMLSDFFSKLR